ncbi:TetR/AcrR family transcriptional regulator [Mycobacterium sp. CVI_P3]|uniref:TetR/AcrR family transcriptional regulator n=1 Tax=Mycobacterium pinniadriaticum TaxID=2994102 RepID=A0ABT3SHR0_9MYCO|nr:TetR/AcrR family transcriptional regulator [Mycobacterium pinniadriaticum]MCX2932641.1 TetR/AcrR family transcriptional regulator [Mycobacterium pinniadriaticum]MCX2939065.1 TetR/AcrR family transcriptional regulator [Mycobacterium pinniadriaticum]
MPDEKIPPALAALWRDPAPTRRAGGLSRERIITAAIEVADADGLGALSMGRLAERLGCGTMSLYRHIANKEELVAFMLSAASGPPPAQLEGADWRAALTDWACGLWDVYHRHPWILAASAAGPPVDPGQLAWLDAGLAALRATDMGERDKLAAVLAVLHFARGAAALAIEAPTDGDGPDYPGLLRSVIDANRFPALASALAAGAFDDGDDSHLGEFRSGLDQLLDGISLKV